MGGTGSDQVTQVGIAASSSLTLNGAPLKQRRLHALEKACVQYKHTVLVCRCRRKWPKYAHRGLGSSVKSCHSHDAGSIFVRNSIQLSVASITAASVAV
eukprot:4795702-Amphidinium_carterae.1